MMGVRWMGLAFATGLLGSCQPTVADPAPEPAVPSAESSSAASASQGAKLAPSKAFQALQERIKPPEGYERLPADPGSFGAWLRARPLKPEGSPVYLYSGHKKRNQGVHVAVLDVDVGSQDLQQCADAIMRLRAEYLFGSGCQEEIAFNFTSGDRASWSEWQRGMRPEVSGNTVTWKRTAEPNGDYATFRRYLKTIFMYAGSASLEGEMQTVHNPALLMPGDVFIEGGFPGHGVIVMDVAENAAGERVFLLAQSYMPAQDIHVLKAPEGLGPWYKAKPQGALKTPEWTFDYGQLKRFKGKCG